MMVKDSRKQNASYVGNSKSARRSRGEENSQRRRSDNQRRRGPRGHGAERQRQEHARTNPGWARRIRSHRRRSPLRRQRPAGARPRGARARGAVSGVSIPGGNPGRQQHLLPESRAQRSAQTSGFAATGRDGVPGRREGKNENPRVTRGFSQAGCKRRLFRRRKKTKRDFPDGGP